MQDKTIFVDLTSDTVSVDGEQYSVPRTVQTDDGRAVFTLSWNPSSMGKTRGFTVVSGDAYGFNDFARLEPHVAAWQDAKAVADAELEAKRQADIAADQEKKEAEEKAIAETQAKIAAEQQAALDRFAPYNTLSSTDFKIIKAMEAKLIAEGAIDPELVAQRAAARQTIRDSKE